MGFILANNLLTMPDYKMGLNLTLFLRKVYIGLRLLYNRMTQIPNTEKYGEGHMDVNKATVLCEILVSGGKHLDDELPAFQKKFKHL